MKPYMILKSTEAIAAQNLIHVEPHLYSDEFPIIPDIIYVSGRDQKDDFEDVHVLQRATSPPPR